MGRRALRKIDPRLDLSRHLKTFDELPHPWNAEELFVIISGKAMLRSPDGFTEVNQNDVIFFEKGPSGAHQLYNHDDAPCVYVDLRTTVGIDVCEYPDSNKINILPYMEIYDSSSKVNYYQGEENVRAKWPAQIVKRR